MQYMREERDNSQSMTGTREIHSGTDSQGRTGTRDKNDSRLVTKTVKFKEVDG